MWISTSIRGLDIPLDLAVDDDLADLDIGFDLAPLADDEQGVRIDRALEIALDPERALEGQVSLQLRSLVDQPGDLRIEDLLFLYLSS